MSLSYSAALKVSALRSMALVFSSVSSISAMKILELLQAMSVGSLLRGQLGSGVGEGRLRIRELVLLLGDLGLHARYLVGIEPSRSRSRRGGQRLTQRLGRVVDSDDTGIAQIGR